MLDSEQQANQIQALASLDHDWHLLEGVKMRLEEDLVIRRSRPTMISAKYRAREERRRLLKISAAKLRRIEDPEASLCRSVLINNAVRRLQRENRDEKSRSYGVSVNFLDDSSKENSLSGNMNVDNIDNDLLQKKRLGDDDVDMSLSHNSSPKKQRHDDLDFPDDVFSDFYILPPTPRLLSHIDDVLPDIDSINDLSINNGMDGVENRLNINIDSLNSSKSRLSLSDSSCQFLNDIAESSLNCNENPLRTSDSRLFSTESCMMDVIDCQDVCDDERITEFARFPEPTKTLEERLIDFQSLDEHYDLSKFERSNSQTCGRAFHDIQTFHSLVPGLET
ncbi:uncharacterized protein LOC124184948 isoform X1 [Neodiprion fabricii]|uniref:uncharacterized protein LOC124184948 isoform X1 n=2 Tax=Neodiprion fabricii TaxID=2872261 RepID=UPI001ED91374|nr:uncharacterized protein LOC124184948 isoform X1 [Neodiprion fabricii]